MLHNEVYKRRAIQTQVSRQESVSQKFLAIVLLIEHKKSILLDAQGTSNNKTKHTMNQKNNTLMQIVPLQSHVIQTKINCKISTHQLLNNFFAAFKFISKQQKKQLSPVSLITYESSTLSTNLKIPHKLTIKSIHMTK